MKIYSKYIESVVKKGISERECTVRGSFDEPGTIGKPVIKSLVSNGRKTIEREHDGIRLTGSRSK